MKRKYELTTGEKYRRHFSESFKMKCIRELESGQVRPCEIHREYDVSYAAIYKWKDKFSMAKNNKKERIIVESESDTIKLQDLRKKLAELERIIGQKQVLLDFKEKMIDLAEEHYGVDIKKKFMDTPSSITGSKDKNSK